MTFTEKYHSLLNDILSKGMWRDDPNRKGHKRKQIPFADITHDLRKGFPAITTKPLYWKSVVVELLWFLKGDSSIKYLLDNNVHIWDKDAYSWYKKQGGNFTFDAWLTLSKTFSVFKEKDEVQDLGRIYPVQWRDWKKYDGSIASYPNVDQISNLINILRTNPLSSEMIVTAWNPAELDQMALPPCHYSFQVSCEPFSPIEFDSVGFVNKDNVKHYLDLQFNMRSSDVMLGLPFNMASYALLASILARMCNMIPRYIRYNGQNVHLYDNQIDAANEQLNRNNCPDDNKRFYDEPTLEMFKPNDIFWTTLNIDEVLHVLLPTSFTLKDYKHHPKLKNQPEMLGYN